MSAVLRLALSRLGRSRSQSATQILVLAAAVALLGAMIIFVGHSLRTMTSSATRSVPVALQGPVRSYAQARALAAGVERQPNISSASPVATGTFLGVSHRGQAGVTEAGQGSILAVGDGYSRGFNAFRLLYGSLRPGQVLLDQQLAATLQARVGERVVLRPSTKAPSQPFTVSGVALVTASDVLFQPLDPQLGPAPAQPPANVAIMGLDTFAHTVAPLLPSFSAAGEGMSVVPGTQSGVQWQVQAQVNPAALSGSPSHALARAGQIRNALERTFTGQIRFVDNLSEALESATSDALYAEAMFIMLALPGALLAIGLAYLAALGSVERDRRELALLRARGASRRQLLALAVTEAGVLGLAAGLLGAVFAFAAVALLVEGAGAVTTTSVLATGVVCIALAITGALAARLGGGMRVLSESVAEGRRSVRRESRPLWQRLYLDLLALTLSGLIYWLTASTGFSAVVNPDSNPTLSLSVYMFFAPALLWIGTTLLLVRLRGRAVELLVGQLGTRRAKDRRDFLLASVARRGVAINRGLTLLGLLLAFGVSLGIFAATYDQQAGVDAQLTLGADVTASAAPGARASSGLEEKIARVPGVAAASGVDHAYAYVGPDLQDILGIEPSSIAKATTLRDSYFLGAGAQTMLARLKNHPDGVIVSKETITDYSLNVGDLLRLRILDHSSGRFRTLPFHVVGAVQEFPSAPRDSFMVANLKALSSADRAGGANVVFAKSSGDPAALAARVAATTRSNGVIVKDVRHQAVQTASSITSVDLTGISHLEEVFVIILAAATMWLFVSVLVDERRNEFATMASLGASRGDIGAFLRSEAAAVVVAATLLAALLGWLLAQMLVAMLQHVFDPPPDHLAVPWSFLGVLLLGAIGGATIALLLAARAVRRLPLGAILREQ